MSQAKRFPESSVASPHYLASAAGLAVLASGGNALDAAVATNLTLGVVTPYLCGYGGDLFAIVWEEGQVSAYNGSGRAPAAATLEAVRSAISSDRMPTFGPLTVTVPGAVEGWFTLLHRFGTMPFSDLAGRALRYARDGFPVSVMAAASIARARARFGWSREWLDVYGEARAGGVLRQPGLARTIRGLCEEGPEGFYSGPIASAIASHLRAGGGLMAEEDLAGHRGEWIEPLGSTYREVEILELPPNTQGVAVLEALNIVEALGPLPSDGLARQHLMIEAMKLALADRDAYVSDPASMAVPAEELASRKWAAQRGSSFDPLQASAPSPGRPAEGGTAYTCAADGAGMCVSLIQSNYMGFGSGVTVPGWGINLQNRGAYFSLDRTHVNAIAPRKRTLHTLIPAMALKDGRPWLVFGSMGGDGQAQTHLQLLARIVQDGEDIQRAIDAPRWVVSPRDWSVAVEARFDPAVIEGLRSLGHRVVVAGQFDPLMGHAHAIEVGQYGYGGATDPRAEGAVLGQ